MTSVKLSKRLDRIAGLIPAGSVIFDVGSDHALLPCYLVAEGIAEKAYAGDNKEGPLSRAIESIERFGLEGRVIPVLSDGLQKAPEDADTVVIAGMGYHTAVKILEEADLKKYSRIIVQVNSDPDKIRSFLNNNKYSIIDEAVILDGSHFYEIIVFTPVFSRAYSDREIEYGPVLLKRREDSFREYLESRIEKLKRINASAHREDYQQKVSEIEDLYAELWRDKI
ncbi:MAG: SAM-dependent methyltransferase [Erysipelotrichaceae bacterium]|nr:SAM-dependent methyltransferase [Erysipelotrichaceae bacterium]